MASRYGGGEPLGVVGVMRTPLIPAVFLVSLLAWSQLISLEGVVNVLSQVAG